MTDHPNTGTRRFTALFLRVLLTAASVPFLCGTAAAADRLPAAIAGMQPAEVLRLGEKMYREGVLPSGEPMQGVIKGDIPLEGSPLTCASCHLRSGYGTAEGTIRTSPIDGKRLYSPVAAFKRIPMRGRSRRAPAAAEAMSRPAYTDETLSQVLRTGVDPAGRQLDSAMPVYSLSGRDAAILVYYLKNLSTGLQPGVTETTLHFATVVADDAPRADREEMVRLLQSFVSNWHISRNMERMLRSEAYLQEGVSRSMRTLSLAVWELKGPPGTWGAQLEEQYRKDPVFAFLGGIAADDWSPVHKFCEDHKIPCIYPLTDFPDLSDRDLYTLYLSKGLAQESEAAARYLHRMLEGVKDRAVVQVFRGDLAGRTMSRTFREAWRELGHAKPEDIVLDDRNKEGPDASFWKGLAEKHKHAIVLLWLHAGDFPALNELTKAQAMPDMIIASSSLLGRSIYALPEHEREAVYLTYPYALPQERQPGAPAAGETQASSPAPLADPAIEFKMRALAATVSGPLARLRSFVYRDYFLELIESSSDLVLPGGGFPRLSFGTGQRFASKGCFMVQVSAGKDPSLVPRSEWVIH